MPATAATRHVAVQFPELYPKQRASVFGPERLAFLEASTKSGKSFGCLQWFTVKALAALPHETAWWVAPSSRQAREMYGRVKAWCDTLPGWAWSCRETPDLEIRFAGAGGLLFLTGEKPDHLYGPDVIAAVIDEASRVREAAFRAIRTTVAHTRGPIRCVGNVTNRINWFYRSCRRAESGNYPGTKFSRITWEDAVEAGVLEAEEVLSAKDDMPIEAWRKLFDAIATDDTGNPFGTDSYLESLATVTLKIGQGWPGDAYYTDSEPYAWGWDLAKAVDWTVGIALDRKGHICRFHRWQHVPWEKTTSEIILLSAPGRGLIDATGVGDPIAEAVHKKRRSMGRFVFTETSRASLLGGLAEGLSGGSIRIPDGIVLEELRHFGYEFTSRGGVRWSVLEGMTDDCVMALALAYRAYQTVASASVSVEARGF